MRTRSSCPPYFIGLRALKKHPEGMTAMEIAEAVGLAKRNALGYIKIWREEKLVYICGWKRPDGMKNLGDWIPVYGLKPTPTKADARKPRPLVEAEKQSRYRAKNRAVINARRRARRALAKGQPITPFLGFTNRNSPFITP